MRGADLAHLRTRADLIARELSSAREVRLAVFAGRGVDADVEAEVEAGRILHFGPGDLYADV